MCKIVYDQVHTNILKIFIGTATERQVVVFSGRLESVKPRAAYGSRSAVRALSSGDE
jgi:hypothetical protein